MAGVLFALSDARPAQGAEIKLEMPKEAFGFKGTLTAQVVKDPDKTYGWFQVRVVKVPQLCPQQQMEAQDAAGPDQSLARQVRGRPGRQGHGGTQGG